MTTEEIYQKYATEIAKVTGDGTWVDWGVMRLGLRLAVQDAHAAGLETCSDLADDLAAIVAKQAQAPDDYSYENEVKQLHAERAVFAAQFARMNDWLAAHEPAIFRDPDLDTAESMIRAYEDVLRAKVMLHIERDELRQQLAQMDADNAGLTKRCAGLETAISDVMQQRDAAQAEIDRLTHENAIAIDTLNSIHPTAIHTNGNGNGSHPTPTDWHALLDDEANDWRISLDAGRRRFADVPKLARLRIIQAILRGTQIDTGNTSAMPSMADYDAIRPQWAPGSTGLTKTFNCAWREILTLTEVAA